MDRAELEARIISMAKEVADEDPHLASILITVAVVAREGAGQSRWTAEVSTLMSEWRSEKRRFIEGIALSN